MECSLTLERKFVSLETIQRLRVTPVPFQRIALFDQAKHFLVRWLCCGRYFRGGRRKGRAQSGK